MTHRLRSTVLEPSTVLGTPQMHSLFPSAQKWAFSGTGPWCLFREVHVVLTPPELCETTHNQTGSPLNVRGSGAGLTGLRWTMFGKVTFLILLHPPGGHQGVMPGLPGPAHVFVRAVAASANSSCSLSWKPACSSRPGNSQKEESWPHCTEQSHLEVGPGMALVFQQVSRETPRCLC